MGIKEELPVLETKLQELKTEFELYFSGSIKAAPIAKRENVERLIRLYSGENMPTTAIKFRFQQIANKFQSYNQYWNRIMREIDEGRFKRDIMRSETKKEAGDISAKTESMEDISKRIFKDFITAKQALGESTQGIKIEQISSIVQKYKEELTEKYKCKTIDFKVSVENGKAKIKALPKL